MKANWEEVDIINLINKTAKFTSIDGKNLYAPIRLSLFGSEHGPDIPILIKILGFDESLNRLKHSIQ